MKWWPTVAFFCGKSHGQRNLLGYSPWDRKELDMTEPLRFHFSRLGYSQCLIIYLWLCWVFIAVHRLSLIESWGSSLLWSSGFSFGGFSRCGAQALERGLSGCGSWASLACDAWILPRPGIQSAASALVCCCFTSEPPEESSDFFF